MGPWWGWLAGWAICTTGILVGGSLADVAAFYMFDLVGLDGLRDSRVAVVVLAVLLIVVMTTICVIGTEVSARLQQVLVFFQVGALALLVAAAVVEWIVGGLPSQAIDPKLSWLSPFSDDYSNLLGILGSIAHDVLGPFAFIVTLAIIADSLSALSLAIAFYYLLPGLACVIYWRNHLLGSVKNFLFIGIAPLLGARRARLPAGRVGDPPG